MLININEKKNLNVPDNINILQACALYNIYIPRFCYHDKLSIAGNCRMCLVEVKGVLKPIASCAMPINKDMQIFTDSKLVKKAREGILEFILLNHPLDCPICDQGGECDLQDQSLLYGNDKGRFYDLKRAVKDKDCGPLIKTIMTRCIQCTRCVRFMKEISGLNYLGVIGRGNSMEISNFLQKSLFSELSGNVIDVCPVGALTSKPYSFVARPWELSSFNTIDLNDIMHVNIRVDIRDTKILRILPRLNSKLNENWISDATRFSYDGFFLNRLSSPFLSNEKKDLISCSWLNILFNFKKLTINKINFVLGDFIDAETNFLIKYICNKHGNFSILNLNQKNYENDFRFNYFFDQKIFDNLSNFNSIFLFNTNLRLENPLLNLRIKKLVDKNLLKVFSFGSSFGYNFLNYNQGNSLKTFLNFIEGKSILNNFFFKSKKNLFIFNWEFFNKIKNNFDFFIFKNENLKFLNENFSFTVLTKDSTSLLSLDLNLTKSVNSFEDSSYNPKGLITNNNLFYLLNAENFNFFFKNLNFLNDNKVILQNNYNPKNSLRNKIDFLLPSALFVEKNATYVNFFGLIQKVKFILFPFKNVRSDFKILYVLFKSFIDFNDNINKLKLNSFFSKYNFNNFNLFMPLLNNSLKFKMFSFNNTLNKVSVTNFYRMNSVVKRSQILFTCYKDVKKIYSNFS